MTEDQWLQSTDLKQLLHHAVVGFKFDRKIRLFSIACIRRILCVYNMEVESFLNAAEKAFDNNELSLKDLQVLAEQPDIQLYQAPFHLARHDKLLSAISVIDGILADTKWEDHGCLPIFREIFGNPFDEVIVEATTLVYDLAEDVYQNRQDVSVLANVLAEQFGYENELSRHLQKSTLHPKGCWVLDLITRKRK